MYEREMMPIRIGILGFGAIGRSVVDSLLEHPDDFDLIGFSDVQEVEDAPLSQLSVASLITDSDVVVEVASHAAVREYGVQILESGTDLMIVSVGALANKDLEDTLLSAGPGNLILCTGALAGIDYIQAAKLLGGIKEISLTSTKKPGVLAQPWMEDSLKDRLAAGDERITVFAGNAREAAEAFPKSSNVSATLALSVGNWEMVKVQVVADPAATQTKHQIELSGDVGNSKFEVQSLPSVLNPATSSVVPYSVVKALKNAYGSGYKIM